MEDHVHSSDNASDSVATNSNKVYVKVTLFSLGLIWIITVINTLIIAFGILTYSTRADGKWSTWGYWSECKFGLRTRTRSCSNPAPSIFGQYCHGISEKYRICNLVSCKETSIAFTAYSLNRKPSFDTILIFTKSELNIGNAYNNVTGKFTSLVNGTYHFSVTLTKFYKRITYLAAYLKINGMNKIRLLSDPANNNNNVFEALPVTASGTYHLNKGDEVFIFGEPDNFYDGVHSQFTGFLITPD